MLFIIRSYFLRFYLHTWFDFLQAGDDNAIAGFQTVSDQPFIADRLRSSDLADFDFIAFTHYHDAGVAARRTGNTLLRYQQGVRVNPFFQTGTDEHPR